MNAALIFILSAQIFASASEPECPTGNLVTQVRDSTGKPRALVCGSEQSAPPQGPEKLYRDHTVYEMREGKPLKRLEKANPISLPMKLGRNLGGSIEYFEVLDSTKTSDPLFRYVIQCDDHCFIVSRCGSDQPKPKDDPHPLEPYLDKGSLKEKITDGNSAAFEAALLEEFVAASKGNRQAISFFTERSGKLKGLTPPLAANLKKYSDIVKRLKKFGCLGI